MFFQFSYIFNINKFIFQKIFCYFAALNTLNRNRRHKTRNTVSPLIAQTRPSGTYIITAQRDYCCRFINT